jgi:ubiquinone/menaquinone biosynthesis C-methylase UbiE
LIFKKLYKNYWKFGFKSYLYDLLTPSAYFASLQSVRENINVISNDIILDVGCGTGQALKLLRSDIESGTRYIGLDLLKTGLDRAKSKVNSFGVKKNTFFIQADFIQGIPIKIASVDCIICHFASYVIYDTNLRIDLMSILFETLKPGGTFVIANPSKSYNPKSIINESAHLDKYSKNNFYELIRKLIVNPLAKLLGLNYIFSQLKNNQWKWFSLEEMIDEVTIAGFEVLSAKYVYGGSGYLVVARKP